MLLAAPALTGATRLAARAALRVGPGLVSVLATVRGDVYRSTLPPEIMVGAQELASLSRVSAVLGGPGGIAPAHLQALRGCGLPRVVDSAALTSPCPPGHFDARAVLTPHGGEFARAFPWIASASQTQEEMALAAARHSGAVVVYKGPVTVVAAPEGRCAVHELPNADLAVAGSGDVLAGLILGVLAQGMPAFEAGCAGVWLHGQCGRVAGRHLIASDLIGALPTVLRGL